MGRTDYPRCKTCKWWDRDPDYPAHHYETLRVNAGPDWGQCRKTDTDEDAALTSHALSIATDVYCSAPLWTAPNFGCIQHEPKEDG